MKPQAVVLYLSLRLVSEGNVREHHMARARRRSEHRGVTRMAVAAHLRAAGLVVPASHGWRVLVTRIGKKKLDSHDNLRSSAKACVDGIADALGLKSDDDARVTWLYAQSTASRYEVRIEVSARLSLTERDAEWGGDPVSVPTSQVQTVVARKGVSSTKRVQRARTPRSTVVDATCPAGGSRKSRRVNRARNSGVR